MMLRMLWFLPVGLLTGVCGISSARHLRHQGETRRRTEARFVLLLAWFPLAVWLLNQIFSFER